jgi:hypothetical protein
MLKLAFLACLLATFSACATDRVIGTAYVDAGEDIGWVEQQPDVLVAASQALAGDWKSPTVSLPLLGGPAFATFSFMPEYGRARGTYSFNCPQQCAELLNADGGVGPFNFSSGRYVIVGRTQQGMMRGLMFTDEFATGFIFDYPDAHAAPPEQISVEFVAPVTFERMPGGG